MTTVSDVTELVSVARGEKRRRLADIAAEITQTIEGNDKVHMMLMERFVFPESIKKHLAKIDEKIRAHVARLSEVNELLKEAHILEREIAEMRAERMAVVARNNGLDKDTLAIKFVEFLLSKLNATELTILSDADADFARDVMTKDRVEFVENSDVSDRASYEIRKKLALCAKHLRVNVMNEITALNPHEYMNRYPNMDEFGMHVNAKYFYRPKCRINEMKLNAILLVVRGSELSPNDLCTGLNVDIVELSYWWHYNDGDWVFPNAVGDREITVGILRLLNEKHGYRSFSNAMEAASSIKSLWPKLREIDFRSTIDVPSLLPEAREKLASNKAEIARITLGIQTFLTTGCDTRIIVTELRHRIGDEAGKTVAELWAEMIEYEGEIGEY